MPFRARSRFPTAAAGVSIHKWLRTPNPKPSMSAAPQTENTDHRYSRRKVCVKSTEARLAVSAGTRNRRPNALDGPTRLFGRTGQLPGGTVKIARGLVHLLRNHTEGLSGFRNTRAQKLLPQAFIDLLGNGFRPDSVCYRSGKFYQ